jgi:hypothetical protein
VNDDLAARFNQRVAALYETAKVMAPYLAVRNQPVLGPEDGLPLARTLLSSANPSEMFAELIGHGCEALTVEFLVLQSPYSKLFTVTELNVARLRLGRESELEDDTPEVEARLERRLVGIYETAKRDMHYDARWFLSMIETRGAVETVRELIAHPEVAGGLAELAEAGRADFRIEALVLEQPFDRLFTAEERALAQKRLARL